VISAQVAAIIAEAANAVNLAAMIAHDTEAYLQTPTAACAGTNTEDYAANIDNTTVQAYNLLGTMSSNLNQLQGTSSTTDQDVLTAQSEIQTLQATLTQSLTQATQTIQSAIGTDTQTVLSQLQTDIGPVNTASDTQLTLQIEDALLVGSEGSVGNGLLMLPATAGGLLTAPASTPNAVSVQNVVNSMVANLKKVDGVTLSTANQQLCTGANTSVKSAAWLTAYADFQGCYRALVATP
jgi:uncharacterized phage infection (PIP) family protein YhgE